MARVKPEGRSIMDGPVVSRRVNRREAQYEKAQNEGSHPRYNIWMELSEKPGGLQVAPERQQAVELA